MVKCVEQAQEAQKCSYLGPNNKDLTVLLILSAEISLISAVIYNGAG